MNIGVKVRLIIFLILGFAPASAHAYIDPGSVSLAVQAVIAAFAGAALTWKHWWYRVKSWYVRFGVLLGFKPKHSKEEDEPEIESSNKSIDKNSND